MRKITILLCSLSLLALGASKPSADSAALQGTWNGHEIGAGPCTLVVRGASLEFHGADSNEWYKANFTLREDTTPKQMESVISDCPVPKYVGKTGYAIYQLKAGKLTITGSEPGNPEVPADFEAPGTRKFVFDRK